MPIEDIIHLLSFYLKTTQFAYSGTYYQKIFGVAVGSPVSAVMANMVMKDMDQRALATSPVKPSQDEMTKLSFLKGNLKVKIRSI